MTILGSEDCNLSEKEDVWACFAAEATRKEERLPCTTGEFCLRRAGKRGYILS
jgi:hypothetical protein